MANDAVFGGNRQHVSSDEAVPSLKKVDSRVHPAPPTDAPETLPKPPPTPGDRVQTCGSLNTSNFDSTNLFLPTKSGTFLAVLSASCFTFLGLLAFSFAEFEASGAVLLRFLGWQLIIYIPTFSVQPVLRNFMFFGLQPHQSLADAWPDAAGTKKRCLRRLLLPCLLHTAAAVVLFTVGVVTFDERHLGILPSFVVAAICVIPQTPLLLRLFGPPCVSKSSYPFRMLPLVGFMPLMGSVAVMSVYIPLRQFGGVWIGLLMPLSFSCYELFGSFLVTRRFIEKFLTQMDVRQAYASTNQGIVVSIAICNLHAMAEGARLTLLYVDNQQNHDMVGILVPIVSGVLWNVLTRIGCLDRFLHCVSRGRWKPNNCSKLLRESGFCMGYPRFGAMWALILVRLCIGTPFSWDSPELLLMVLVFLSEVVEDLISWVLWRLKINVTPAMQWATDQEVGVKVQRRLSHRLSQGSLLPVTPQVTPQVTSRTSDEDRWKVRVAHDFKFGPTDFGELPFWAHFMPAATAQFHTIFSMIVASNGLVFLLDLCDPRETGQIGLIWWPIGDDLCH